jgi:hypothetical protein
MSFGKRMKKLLLISFLLTLSLSWASAQWKKVGWEGARPNILANIGDTIFSLYHSSFFRSIDKGITWQEISAGIPQGYLKAYCQSITDDDQYFYRYRSQRASYDDNVPLRFYRLKFTDTAWEQFEISLPSYTELSQIISLNKDTILLRIAKPGSDIRDSDYFLSTDKGKHWQPRNLRSPGSPSYPGQLKKYGGKICVISESDGLGELEEKNWIWKPRNFGLPDTRSPGISFLIICASFHEKFIKYYCC